MNCEQVKEHLSAYLDNALTSEERQYVTEHIETCQSCQNILADFARFDALLAQLPRISPGAELQKKIFAAQEALELRDSAPGSLPAAETGSVFSMKKESRPQLISLPGGRQTLKTDPSSLSDHPSLSKNTTYPLPTSKENKQNTKKKQPTWGQHILYSILAASLLLTLGIGGLISWKLWQRQKEPLQTADAITPPAAFPQQGPLPAGSRFLFLRDGSLWSCPDDGNNGAVRLTPEQVTVGYGWTVRPEQDGHKAGNLVAYIDTQQGLVHIIRSDGQKDTIIPQPLMAAKELNTTSWQNGQGMRLLNSLAWSPDGSTLAFVGEKQGQKQLALYLYQPTANSVQKVSLSLQINGSISQPVWSPDNKRIAFQITEKGSEGIAEYNLQNQESLSIIGRVSTQQYQHDTVQALYWSTDITSPAITWSVGSTGHIHGIWLKKIGGAGDPAPLLLKAGDYIQASYSQTQNDRWLFVTAPAGLDGDIYTVNLHGILTQQTLGKEVVSAQWSPDGRFISYLDTFISNTAILHLIDTQTRVDMRVAAGVVSNPAPGWSIDQQRLAYSTGTQIFILNTVGQNQPYALKTQGKVTTLSWSNNHPSQMVLAFSDKNEGVYLFDSHKKSLQEIDTTGMQGEIQWSEIP